MNMNIKRISWITLRMEKRFVDEIFPSAQYHTLHIHQHTHRKTVIKMNIQ